MGHNDATIVEIFTDGACSGNPGVGGYGAILRYGNKTREISGCEMHTTNNRMELTAVIEALKQLKRPSTIRVITDSKYVVQGMTQWISSWQKKNWVNAQKNPVLNRDLWELLLRLSLSHRIEWQWVRGHHGHKENERCDELAKQAIKNCHG
jgi:ribonuclease HI